MSSAITNRPVLVHIGYPKCASTFLQLSVLPHVGGIEFVGKWANPGFYESILRAEIDFDPDNVVASLPKGEVPLVVSLESLVRHPLAVEPGGAGYIARRLKTVFPGAHICIIIRNQFDAIESMMLEYLKGGGAGGIGVNAFRALADINAFDLSHFCYARVIRYYNSVFGANHVHTLFLEDLARDADEFVAEFLAPVGASVGSLESWNRGAVRERVSPFGYAFLRLANFPRHGRFNASGVVYSERVSRTILYGTAVLDRLYRIAPILGPHASLMSRRNRLFVENFYKEDNRVLAELTGRDVEALGYPTWREQDQPTS